MARQWPPDYMDIFQGFELINGNTFDSPYGTLPPTEDPVILELFSKTQVAPSGPFHNHPAILMTVNYLQKQHDWSWRDKEAYKKIFPGLNRSLSPDSITIERSDNARLNTGAYGLLGKCFANYGGKYSDNVNTGKCDSEIRSLDQYIRQNGTFLFAEYLRHSRGMAPSASKVAQYKSLLLSHAYRYLKEAQYVSGSWSNAELEMYMHFVKLLACGASQAEVRDVYRELTTVEPILSPSAFRAITDTRWTSYGAWLGSGILDWGDMNAKNLADYVMIGGRSKLELAYKYLQRFDYYASSGSCFAAGTQVALGNGASKAIEDIQEGDQVASSLFGSFEENEAKATVAFVSKIRRKGRTLFAYRYAPSIKFSDTHPLVPEPKSNDIRGPHLLFVDPERATSVNPTWQSIPTIKISPDELTPHPPGTINGDEEFLYDLVLEPPAGSNAVARTYTVIDPNGQCLKALSEAPIFEWFPYATKFFERLFAVLRQDKQEMSSLFRLLCDEHIDFTGMLNNAIRETGIQMQSRQQLTNKESGFVVASRFLTADEGKGYAMNQSIADFAEKLISLLGRQINNMILTGWANTVASEENARGQPATTVLLLHSLHILDSPRPAQARVDNFKGLKVSVIQDGTEVASEAINATVRGWQTFEIGRGIGIGNPSFTKHDDRETISVNLEIHDVGAGIVYHGGGPVHEGVDTRIALAGESGDEYAVLEAKLQRMHQDTLESQFSWGDSERATVADVLGECFAEKMIDALRKSNESE
ncbi:hypothetical protein D8B26_007163 [Coccidioides posadasii str. Silveira]|uniref:uncharacterized protein n=1 Tax=Coccidioides posadasii (strain RMSCC 757 / Silveira) TaxID=443226 RepID=UPI001BF0B52A|nr:hypothetical protein D8B26_007163 [Coccidioides posadasii str. Silveira]